MLWEEIIYLAITTFLTVVTGRLSNRYLNDHFFSDVLYQPTKPITVRILLNLALLLVINSSSITETDIYFSAMKECISNMNNAQSIADYQYTANSFERISNARPDQWLPLYYCSYCYTQMSFLTNEASLRDTYVNRADELISKADNICPDNSEIYVLKGFILQAFMNIEPLTRGMKYNNKCINLFKTASNLNPENPRSYLWHSVQLLNIPAFMGGRKEKAIPLLEKAIECFKNFKPENEISPDWGYNYAKEKLNEVRGSKNKSMD